MAGGLRLTASFVLNHDDFGSIIHVIDSFERDAGRKTAPHFPHPAQEVVTSRLAAVEPADITLRCLGSQVSCRIGGGLTGRERPL
jgi:hypothetical protein